MAEIIYFGTDGRLGHNPNWQPKSFEEFIKLGNICREAIKELSKSDWVSVEDGLPPYEEDVEICNIKYPDDVYISHRDNGEYPEDVLMPMMDDNGFIIDVSNFLGKVTHWKPIEKLEE